MLLLIIACICFALAALGVTSPVNLVAAGLFFWSASLLGLALTQNTLIVVLVVVAVVLVVLVLRKQGKI